MTTNSAPALLDSTLWRILTSPIDMTGLDATESGILREALAQVLEDAARKVLSEGYSFAKLLTQDPRTLLVDVIHLLDRIRVDLQDRGLEDTAHVGHLRAVQYAITMALHPRSGKGLAIHKPVSTPTGIAIPAGAYAFMDCPHCGFSTAATEELCEQCGSSVTA